MKIIKAACTMGVEETAYTYELNYAEGKVLNMLIYPDTILLSEWGIIGKYIVDHRHMFIRNCTYDNNRTRAISIMQVLEKYELSTSSAVASFVLALLMHNVRALDVDELMTYIDSRYMVDGALLTDGERKYTCISSSYGHLTLIDMDTEEEIQCHASEVSLSYC